MKRPLSLSRLAYHKPWALPKKDELDFVWNESEYAGWLLCHGIRVNHFTIYINALKKFRVFKLFNAWLIEQGYTLNESGGVIKGSVELGLEQSSTMAPSR